MVGEPFNKRSVPCAFGIKIGLYFQFKILKEPYNKGKKLESIGIFRIVDELL